MSREIEERVKVLQSMDEVIRAMEHEMAYENWILVVPDEADYEDFEDIANDEWLWNETQKAFVSVVKEYGRHGW